MIHACHFFISPHNKRSFEALLVTNVYIREIAEDVEELDKMQNRINRNFFILMSLSIEKRQNSCDLQANKAQHHSAG